MMRTQRAHLSFKVRNRVRSKAATGFLQQKLFLKFCNNHRNIHVLQYLFNKEL